MVWAFDHVWPYDHIDHISCSPKRCHFTWTSESIAMTAIVQLRCINTARPIRSEKASGRHCMVAWSCLVDTSLVDTIGPKHCEQLPCAISHPWHFEDYSLVVWETYLTLTIYVFLIFFCCISWCASSEVVESCCCHAISMPYAGDSKLWGPRRLPSCTMSGVSWKKQTNSVSL